MGKLKVLPANIANMIAAGEVVQRPASVVKELMENAVDAGASQVDVIIRDSGRTLIQVIDNGCGMSPSDAVLCFERHATSKIATADDLEGILTYGFRGEALASIAAVAEITLKTRRAQDETGIQVTLDGFNDTKTSSVSTPAGSNFSVRNLFYNTPARRKFLKSDAVEFKHIVEEFIRVSLTRPETGFSLNHNGKEIYVLRKAKSLKFRIMDLLGTNVVGDVVDINAETSVVKVGGFIGRPDTARKTAGNQYFFINGRYFHSAYLHKAVMKAYEEMMPEGLTPSYFIYLDADPHTIDVNIHPTKTEIKFEEDTVVFQILYACVKETLGKNSFGASIDFDTAGMVSLPQLGSSFEQYRGGINEPSVDFDPDYNPFENRSSSGSGFPAFPPAVHQTPYEASAGHYSSDREDCSPLFEQKTVASPQNIILQGKYIVTPVASGMMVVNVRRARERILYERALKALSSETHITQSTLFPVRVQVGVRERLVFDENRGMLSGLGFDIVPDGDDAIVVKGVPEGYSCESGSVDSMVSDLLLILQDKKVGLPEMMTQNMAEKFATLGAVNSAPLTSGVEARMLIDTLFACENAEITSGGKRIVTIIRTDEIEKRF